MKFLKWFSVVYLSVCVLIGIIAVIGYPDFYGYSIGVVGTSLVLYYVLRSK
jgi:hypothetical protein